MLMIKSYFLNTLIVSPELKVTLLVSLIQFSQLIACIFRFWNNKNIKLRKEHLSFKKRRKESHEKKMTLCMKDTAPQLEY